MTGFIHSRRADEVIWCQCAPESRACSAKKVCRVRAATWEGRFPHVMPLIGAQVLYIQVFGGCNLKRWHRLAVYRTQNFFTEHDRLCEHEVNNSNMTVAIAQGHSIAIDPKSEPPEAPFGPEHHINCMAQREQPTRTKRCLKSRLVSNASNALPTSRTSSTHKPRNSSLFGRITL